MISVYVKCILYIRVCISYTYSTSSSTSGPYSRSVTPPGASGTCIWDWILDTSDVSAPLLSFGFSGPFSSTVFSFSFSSSSPASSGFRTASDSSVASSDRLRKAYES